MRPDAPRAVRAPAPGRVHADRHGHRRPRRVAEHGRRRVVGVDGVLADRTPPTRSTRCTTSASGARRRWSWSATASTTLPRSRPPASAWPWARGGRPRRPRPPTSCITVDRVDRLAEAVLIARRSQRHRPPERPRRHGPVAGRDGRRRVGFLPLVGRRAGPGGHRRRGHPQRPAGPPGWGRAAHRRARLDGHECGAGRGAPAARGWHRPAAHDRATGLARCRPSRRMGELHGVDSFLTESCCPTSRRRTTRSTRRSRRPWATTRRPRRSTAPTTRSTAWRGIFHELVEDAPRRGARSRGPRGAAARAVRAPRHPAPAPVTGGGAVRLGDGPVADRRAAPVSRRAPGAPAG